MKFTAAQIAGILEGTVEGNPEVEVSKLAKIEEGTKDLLPFLLILNIHHIYILQKHLLLLLIKTLNQKTI